MSNYQNRFTKINQDSADNQRKTLSLIDLIKHKPDPNSVKLESYLLKKSGGLEEEQTLVVKRIDINFSKKKCQVLNLADITSIIRLEREKEKFRTIRMLNTSVHHEMIAPLRA